MKVARELGLKRREAVWSPSTVSLRKLLGSNFSTRGPGMINLWHKNC